MRPAAMLFVMLWPLMPASMASAHFLFVRICPPAEGGRAAEVYFSEYAAAGDPRYIDKVAKAEFSIQTTPGEFRPLPMSKQSDRLRAHLPISGTLMVAGQLDYGVLRRPAQPPFLLRHYSKAVAGTAQEINRLTPKGSPLEVVAQFEGDLVVLSALLGGKPLPGAKFTTVDSDLSNEELTADADGRATFKPPAKSVYAIYVPHVDHVSGDHAGESYQEIRQFATLAFSWPLAPQDTDAEAVASFEEALAARATWQDFSGFSAKLAGSVDGRPYDGTVLVKPDGSVVLEIDDEAVALWVQSQLESITMHRAASQSAPARPLPVLRYADDRDDHPLGRLLAFEGGQFATSYRVKDRQITSVNRLLEGKNMTITVLDNEMNADGKFLPRSYTVQYWDDGTGKLERAESVVDRWIRVGSWDLPAEHRVSTSSDGGASVRSIKLSGHQVTAAKAE
jgi:hypothetical protein